MDFLFLFFSRKRVSSGKLNARDQLDTGFLCGAHSFSYTCGGIMVSQGDSGKTGFFGFCDNLSGSKGAI